MAPPAVAMTEGILEDTVDFRPNYDSRETEPSVLPAAIPHLVVNGATGIAVGMATNCAPHNLVEVVQALRHLIKHPDARLETVMRFIPGPDLPTGGKIVGLDGIKEAYETGRGTFRMRATARVETLGRRKGIVVTELPYGVGTEKVVERIKTLVQGKKLQGISDIKDLTDRAKGLRLVIEVKNGFVPEALLEQLYRQTPMEDTFGINAVALVDGQPRTLGLMELLRVFLDHRFEVVRRRSVFRRGKAADRLHLVHGLLIAIIDIDEVIQLIRTSDNTAMAKERLIQVFDLTEVQADYILEMPLRRLTRFSRIELEKEQSELEATIEGLDAIIDNESLRWNVVSDELAEVAKTFGTPRRTVLLESAGTTVTATAAPLEVADDPCFAFLSSSGLLARSSSDEVPGSGDGRANHDVVVSVVRTTARGEVGVLTTRGRVLKIGVLDLPALPPSANDPNLQGGLPISEVLSLESGERALALTVAAHRRPGPGHRHPPGRGQAGEPRGAHQPRRVGGDRPQGRRRGGRRDRPGHRHRDALLHHQRRPAAALHRRRGAPPGSRRAAGWPASGCPPASGWPGSAPSTLRTPSWSPPPAPRPPSRARSRAPSRSRPSRSTPPRAAPPAACAATGSSRARTPSCWPGPERRPRAPPPPAAPRSTCPRRPASGTARGRPDRSRSRPSPDPSLPPRPRSRL